MKSIQPLVEVCLLIQGILNKVIQDSNYSTVGEVVLCKKGPDTLKLKKEN